MAVVAFESGCHLYGQSCRNHAYVGVKAVYRERCHLLKICAEVKINRPHTGLPFPETLSV